MREWFWGWVSTIRIYLDRDLYRELTQDLDISGSGQELP